MDADVDFPLADTNVLLSHQQENMVEKLWGTMQFGLFFLQRTLEGTPGVLVSFQNACQVVSRKWQKIESLSGLIISSGSEQTMFELFKSIEVTLTPCHPLLRYYWVEHIYDCLKNQVKIHLR